MKFELRPHEGVGDIRFGMSRVEVRRRLGQPVYSDGKKDFFVGGALHVHYDTGAHVSAIVVAAATGGQAIFAGVDLLALDADEAVAVVRKVAELDERDPEYPMMCTFPAIDLNLWRSCLPDDADDPAMGRKFEAATIAAAGYFSH